MTRKGQSISIIPIADAQMTEEVYSYKRSSQFTVVSSQYKRRFTVVDGELIVLMENRYADKDVRFPDQVGE